MKPLALLFLFLTFVQIGMYVATGFVACAIMTFLNAFIFGYLINQEKNNEQS